MRSGRIYLDANASYGLLPQVAEELRSLLPELAQLGNPSAVHADGQRARALIEDARREVRALVDADPHDRIVFTSGATEANNAVLRAPFEGGRKGRVVSSAIEHPCVLEPLSALESQGVAVHLVAPDSSGSVSAQRVDEACAEPTTLVALMLANNETGALIPVATVAAALKERSPATRIHCDAAQAIGKVPCSFRALGVDSLSISGHKFGALSGVGALVVRAGSAPCALLRGGPQETRWRAGTENLIGIVSMGIAARVVRSSLEQRRAEMARSRGQLLAQLREGLPELRCNTPLEESLPNTLSVTIPGVDADDLVVALDLQGVALSSGAACASGKPDPSHVLLAMGMTEQEARATIRISVRAEQDAQKLYEAGAVIIETVRRMREAQQRRSA